MRPRTSRPWLDKALAGAALDPAGGDAAGRLQRATAMLEARLISDSEYEALKVKVINQL